MNPMSHEERLSAYLDGELSSSEKASVEAWLQENAAARQWLAEMTALRQSFKELPTISVNAAFTQRVLQAIDKRTAKTPNVPRSFVTWPWLSAGIAATLLVGILSLFSLQPLETEMVSHQAAYTETKGLRREMDGLGGGVGAMPATEASETLSSDLQAASLPEAEMQLQKGAAEELAVKPNVNSIAAASLPEMRKQMDQRSLSNAAFGAKNVPSHPVDLPSLQQWLETSLPNTEEQDEQGILEIQITVADASAAQQWFASHVPAHSDARDKSADLQKRVRMKSAIAPPVAATAEDSAIAKSRELENAPKTEAVTNNGTPEKFVEQEADPGSNPQKKTKAQNIELEVSPIELHALLQEFATTQPDNQRFSLAFSAQNGERLVEDKKDVASQALAAETNTLQPKLMAKSFALEPSPAAGATAPSSSPTNREMSDEKAKKEIAAAESITVPDPKPAAAPAIASADTPREAAVPLVKSPMTKPQLPADADAAPASTMTRQQSDKRRIRLRFVSPMEPIEKSE